MRLMEIRRHLARVGERVHITFKRGLSETECELLLTNWQGAILSSKN